MGNTQRDWIDVTLEAARQAGHLPERSSTPRTSRGIALKRLREDTANEKT